MGVLPYANSLTKTFTAVIGVASIMFGCNLCYIYFFPRAGYVTLLPPLNKPMALSKLNCTQKGLIGGDPLWELNCVPTENKLKLLSNPGILIGKVVLS